MRTLSFLFAPLLSLSVLAQDPGPDRVPGDTWMRYGDVAEAGFDADRLEAARQTWEGMPSSAFMVVADGAVVAAWGDVERRYMCHSVRKSFLSALYGIYWDKGELELNKTLADLGLDDAPSPLLESEKQARILDLLKARSGVFHPAAYAGRTDSRPRGSEGPGRYFAYNNWDFNTLAHILTQETGADVFEAFGEYFAEPLGMQDFRVSDGYYHYELDKSLYPAYPFRMSARDAARFGLLFTRLGDWNGEAILSKHWVRRSTALYSLDGPMMGYGFMWWVFREPRMAKHGMVGALGVGNQLIAALPESGLVIVNRANTFDGESTPTMQLVELIAEVLEARTGAVAAEPTLVPLEPQPRDARFTRSTAAELEAFVGTFNSPPAPLGQPAQREVEMRLEGDRLFADVENFGLFEVHLQPDGSFVAEDSLTTYYVVRSDGDGGFVVGSAPDVADLPIAGFAEAAELQAAGLQAASRGNLEQARKAFAGLDPSDAERELTETLLAAISGAEVDTQVVARLATQVDAATVEARINGAGYALLQSENAEGARKLFQLNADAFPESANAWDSLAEAHMTLGDDEEATRLYEKSLSLDGNNHNARAMIERIRGSAEPAQR